jgi:hypothetical protein
MKRIPYAVLAIIFACTGLMSANALAETVKLTAGGIPTTWTPTWKTRTSSAKWLYDYYAGNPVEETVAYVTETTAELWTNCSDGVWQEDFDRIIDMCGAIEDPDKQLRCAWAFVHYIVKGYEIAADAEYYGSFGDAMVANDAWECRHYARTLSWVLSELGFSSGLEAGFDGIGGHAWNEVYLEDGRTIILDSYNMIAIEIAAP